MKFQSIAHLWVSVIAFSSTSSSFSAYGGTVTIARPGTSNLDLIDVFTKVQNPLYGLNKFLINIKQHSTIDIHVDNNFIMTIGVQGGGNFFQLNYLFVGYLPQELCKNCIQTQQGVIYFEGTCRKSCPSYTYLMRLKNNGQVCRALPTVTLISQGNTNSNQNGNGQNFVQGGLWAQSTVKNQQTSSGGGRTIGSGSTWPQSQGNQGATGTTQGSGSTWPQSQGNQGGNQGATGTTQGSGSTWPQSQGNQGGNPSNTQNTSPLTSNSGGSIIIPLSGQPNPSLGKVSPPSVPNPIHPNSNPNCPGPNMFHNSAQCLCLVGYSLIKNTCTKLSILTPTITPPTPPNQCPGANQIHNGTTCVCISGFFMVNNVCRSCPPNSVWNGNLCKCKNGFTLVNGVCVNRSSVVCPANSFNNGLGICICRLKNHRMVNNKC